MKIKGNSGFSLVELMVVVGIIGILATLALPKLSVFMAKAKQGEAKTNLGSIYTLQSVYKAEKDTFDTSLSNIGFSTPPGNKYTYAVSSASATAFLATATNAGLCSGTGGADAWNINQDKNLQRSTSTPLSCN